MTPHDMAWLSDPFRILDTCQPHWELHSWHDGHYRSARQILACTEPPAIAGTVFEEAEVLLIGLEPGVPRGLNVSAEMLDAPPRSAASSLTDQADGVAARYEDLTDTLLTASVARSATSPQQRDPNPITTARTDLSNLAMPPGLGTTTISQVSAGFAQRTPDAEAEAINVAPIPLGSPALSLITAIVALALLRACGVRTRN